MSDVVQSNDSSAVPSPYLIDCPTIESLSIDSAEAFIMPGATGWVTDRWYRLDLDAGEDYVLNSWGILTSGLTGSVQYDITHADQFGQYDRFETANSVDKPEVTGSAGNGLVVIAESGPHWVRIQNKNQSELRMEFGVLRR